MLCIAVYTSLVWCVKTVWALVQCELLLSIVDVGLPDGKSDGEAKTLCATRPPGPRCLVVEVIINISSKRHGHIHIVSGFSPGVRWDGV